MGHKISDGRAYVATATATHAKDDPVEYDGIFGFADLDVVSGESLSISIGQEEREVTLPAKAGGWAVGDLVYWTGSAFIDTSTGNRLVGRVTRAVAAGGGVGWMLVSAIAWSTNVSQA